MRFSIFLPLAFAGFILAGCASPVPKAGYLPAGSVPEDASPVPVLFRGVEFLLPVGADIGHESTGSRLCGWPRHPVSRTALRNVVDHEFLTQTFHGALEAQGYDVVGSLDLAYDRADDEARAEYSVTAKVRNVQLEICHKEADDFLIFFTTKRGTAGEFYMEVDWTIYDALRRTVVYKTGTQGYTNRRAPSQEGLALMFSEAFEMAAHNLGGDPQFRDLLVSGIRPEAPDEDEARPRLFAPDEKIMLQQNALSVTPFTDSIDDRRRLAVMVQKFGHGTGFFIGDQGHLLTNAHVVGDGLRTRIVTADGAHTLIAEVLRIDKARDVALLKLEEAPAELKIFALPVRAAWPAVGEDVYAIGAPRNSRTLQDTITKGIVSAHRKNMKFLGTRQNFIQADVEIHQGSSGGPLLDANGNIIGMAVGIHGDAGATGIGLNYFIPIEEALAALDIGLTD